MFLNYRPEEKTWRWQLFWGRGPCLFVRRFGHGRRQANQEAMPSVYPQTDIRESVPELCRFLHVTAALEKSKLRRPMFSSTQARMLRSPTGCSLASWRRSGNLPTSTRLCKSLLFLTMFQQLTFKSKEIFKVHRVNEIKLCVCVRVCVRHLSQPTGASQQKCVSNMAPLSRQLAPGATKVGDFQQ